MAGLATHPQKAVLQASAFEIRLELPLHVVRQRPARPGHVFNEPRVVLLDDPVEQGLLGPVTLVSGGAPWRVGTPCRRGARQGPRPCEAV